MPSEVPPAKAAAAASRWSVLDTFRGLAVLLMIQGHTFTALVEKSTFQGWWVRLYTLFHGLTAPMFLVGGGLAYGMVSARRRGGHTRALDTRIVRRGLTLIALGYALQWPQVSLLRLPEYPAQFMAAFAIGPLQLVGLCLLLCELAWGLLRSRLAYRGCLLALALGLTLCSPWAWQPHVSASWAPPWGMWIDGYGGSLFPFFPWAAFFFLGVLASDMVPLARRAPRLVACALLGGGLAGARVIYAMWERGERLEWLYGEHEFWHTSPMYVGFRSLLVLAILGALIALEPACQAARRALPRAARLFDTLSRQSLVAYVTHLFVLYGTPFTAGIVRFGRVFDLREASVIFLGVATYTLAIAVLWDHFEPAQLLGRLMRKLSRPEVDRVGERERDRVVASEQELEPASTVDHR